MTESVYLQGVTSPGGNLLYAPKLAGDVQKLLHHCANVPICIGKECFPSLVKH